MRTWIRLHALACLLGVTLGELLDMRADEVMRRKEMALWIS